jgi:uncharacterized protein YndB with AHSA1/START domain
VRTALIAAGSLLAGISVSAAAEYTSITLEKIVERPADAVWAKVGPFCAIKDWLKTTCEYTSGSGDIGTVRVVEGKYHEVLVGKTPHSYTYAFQEPNPTMYHGTLSVVPQGRDKSKLIYIMLWDQEKSPTPEAKAKERAGNTEFATHALDNMKQMAEGK